MITRTWTSSDQNVATIDANGVITIINAGTTTIKCVQESTKDDAVSDSVTFTVKPKPMTVTVDDVEIGMGEELPEFTYSVEDGAILAQDLATFLAPAFSCVDKDGIAISNSTKPGTYAIQAVYDTTQMPYKNYKITIISGTLTIGQEPSQATWLTLIGHDSKETLNNSDWHKESVEITLNETNSASYDEISMDEATWSKSILITNEGKQEITVYFRNSTTLSQATPQKVTIKIDYTEPVIESISGVPVKQSTLEKTLNQLTYGTWFKPNDQLTIKAKDIDKSTVNEISGLYQLHYVVYELDEKLVKSNTPYMDQTVPMNTNTKTLKIANPGQYRICATVKDMAGNESAENCSDVHIKKINVDVDEDEIPDFNDTDDNGCPDLNIVLGTDQNGNKVKLNVAEQDKNYPYMNIDSNGDGKADLNIDTDYDGKPDLNLVDLSKETPKGAPAAWQPKICVLKEQLTAYSEPNEYCTGTIVKPKINVDTTGNGIPNINIDTDGDMKADINIDQNQNGILDKYDFNITSEIKTWKPKNDYTYQNFLYDTESEHKAYVNVIVKGTSLPSLNIDTDGDGLPDLNIDADGNGIPEINVDITGDGIADINLDPDQTGTPVEKLYTLTEWKPNTNITGENFDYMTMVIEGFTELKDQGISVTPSNPDQIFLPNYALKVVDITDDQKETIREEASIFINDGEDIEIVYNITLLEGDVEIQPNGTLNVRIPLSDGVKNPRLLMKKADGTYEEVSITIKDGYIEYETDELGIVSILGTKIEDEPSIEPDHPDSSASNQPNHDSDVKTTYTSDLPNTISGVGGAVTGDDSNNMTYVYISLLSLGMLFSLFYIRKSKE